MARWEEFVAEEPQMAEAGAKLIYQHGGGLGYLATVRKDGGPRMHPFCPVITGGGIYGLIGPSPKRADLLRDGRVAIHSFPMAEGDDEFYLAGHAVLVDDPKVKSSVLAAYLATGATNSGDELFFEFLIDTALLATYGRRADGTIDWPPEYRKWRAPKEVLDGHLG